MKKHVWYIFLLLIIGISACAPKSFAAQDSIVSDKPENVERVSDSASVDLNTTEENNDATEKQGDTKTALSVSLNTTMGELTIVSVKFVDEANGVKPGPDEKILLVGLSKAGVDPISPSNFSLEEFQAMVYDTSKGDIYILGDDGSKSTSSMAGWVGPDYKEFAMGFKLPKSITSYTLMWPENDPIELIPSY